LALFLCAGADGDCDGGVRDLGRRSFSPQNPDLTFNDGWHAGYCSV